MIPLNQSESAQPNRTDTASRMDTHVHSSASSGPAIAALGLINCPECCSPPEAVYEQARTRGMTHVTLTDHDTIDGALELTERNFENVIIGQEVTVRFPEDGRSIHCLVWGITPAEHEQLGALRLRDDIYSFAHWLKERNLPHAVAHPLDGIGDTRAVWRLQRLALLFRGFELLNGAHAGAHAHTVKRWVNTLTPDRLTSISKQHHIKPLWPTDAPRAITAGSDDHGLLNVGTVATQIDHQDNTITAREFIDLAMLGNAQLIGSPGTPELLAHQFISVGTNRFAKPIADKLPPTRQLLARKIASFAGVTVPKPSKAALTIDALRKRSRNAQPNQSHLINSLSQHFTPALNRHSHIASTLSAPSAIPALAHHQSMSAFTEELLNTLTADLAHAAHSAWQQRDWTRLRALAKDTGALALAQAPYIVSLFLHNKDRWGVKRIERELDDNENTPITNTPTRIALFTDTLAETNGVSRFLTQLSLWALANNKDLHVFSFDHPDIPDSPNIHPIAPIHSAPLPGYDQLSIHLPPLLTLLRRINELQPDAIHVSTPGPMGLAGALAASMLRVPYLCTHHTDFPAYANRLFPNTSIPKHAETLLRKLYSKADTVLTRSSSYTAPVRRLRVTDERIQTIPPGVDSQTFSPEHRDLNIWNGTVRMDAVKVLYAGRISVEKNTHFLEQLWKIIRRRCEERDIDAELIVVGDGPDRARLERALKPFESTFLGTKPTKELATIYASSDLFLFPSTTDTLGQVVLEAQASGLPAIVSTAGGPQEIIEHNVTGFALPPADPAQWVEHTMQLILSESKRKAMSTAARARAEARTTHRMFDFFWNTHEQAISHHELTAGITDPDHHSHLISDALLTRLAAHAAAI